MVFYLCPSSVRVVASFPGTVLFPFLCSVLPFFYLMRVLTFIGIISGASCLVVRSKSSVDLSKFCAVCFWCTSLCNKILYYFIISLWFSADLNVVLEMLFWRDDGVVPDFWY
jgi:hypothetical protein